MRIYDVPPVFQAVVSLHHVWIIMRVVGLWKHILYVIGGPDMPVELIL
jgi:hypothetical protein